MDLLRQAACNPGSAQLQKQRHSCPPTRVHPAIPVFRSAAVLSASSGIASKAASANAPCAFAEAGLSQGAIDYILTQYPSYLGWDVEQKLLAAMQQKQQELGAKFPSAFRRSPRMLLRSTEVMPKAQTACKAAKAKAASDNASKVKAAFAAAGLSQDAADYILTRYQPYLRWDVEQKLLPAIQRWQHELGRSFLSDFKRIPSLLVLKAEEEKAKDAYLTSIGVNSYRRLRQRQSTMFRLSLMSMQGRVAVLEAHGFTQAQVTSLIKQHPDIITRTSGHVEGVLRTISDIFDCAQGMDALSEVVLSCHRLGVFSLSPAALRHNFTYFCTCVGANDKETQRAWRNGIFITSPAELDIRLDSVAAQLDTTLVEAKGLVRRIPEISTLLPETVGLHVMQLHDLGFSRHQVKSMCSRQPSMLTLNYNTQLQADKWEFLTCVLQLSHDAIASRPQLLMSSLPNRLGPRWAYLQQLRLHGLIAFTAAPQVFQSLLFCTDLQFRARHTSTAPGLNLYDEHFQKQWQQQWNHLLVDQQLSIQDIAQNPTLLHISLKDPIEILDFVDRT